MKKTFIDKFVLGYLGIIIMVFFMLLIYSTYAIQNSLIQEKQATLMNEATLISEQCIQSYLNGTISANQLQEEFNQLENSLAIRIWYADADGDFIAISHKERYSSLPNNLFELVGSEHKDLLDTPFSMTGKFYHTFSSRMITVGVPINRYSKPSGYIIVHTSISQLDTIQATLIANTYIPFLILIILSMIILAYLSKKILLPLKKLNVTAKEYASGNFKAKTEIVREDELGELARNLEFMADELNKLDEYRGEFISNISHDFRSPLTSIKGYVEAMLDGTIPPENQEKYLNIVLTETKRLTKLTSSLLELKSFDTIGPVLQRKNFDIVSVIQNTLDTFEGTCERKYIKLNINVPTSSVMVNADKSKIEQVVYNLVDNAIKFSPHGATITITIIRKKSKVYISVKDSGVGISKNKQNKIWDRFYKTDASRGKDRQGTGLGLSITRAIIEAHNEHISVISTEGIGSEFTFSLSSANPDMA